MRCPFDDYSNVTYMPFTKYDDKYNDKMRGVIAHHKKIKGSLEIIRIPRFNQTHPNMELTGDFSSIRDIILSFNTAER